MELHYALIPQLGFDLFSQGLANLFFKGPDSKCLGLCGPHLILSHILRLFLFWEFFFPFTTLKKCKNILGFLVQKQAGRQFQGSCQRNPAVCPHRTRQRSASPSGDIVTVEGLYCRAQVRAPRSLGVRVPEAFPAQPHRDSSPDELIRVPGTKRANLSPKVE